MSDDNQSGAPSTAPGAASTGENPGFGVFGANRGSGLVRGKRATPPAANAAAPAASSGYKPSSLEVITSKSEYVNPFTGETTVSAPVTNEPAPQADPVPPAAPVASVAPAREAAPATSAPAPAELFPLDPPAAPAEKPALKILPTEEPRRPAVSWESPAGAPAAQPQRRDDRPAFRPEQERREGKPFAPREPRRDERKFEPRDKQPYQPRQERDDRPERIPEPAPAKKPGGFLGWLKGLFGGSKPAETPATGGDFRPERDGEHGGRRRHRGGRGRGGFRSDNRGGQPYQHRDPRDEAGQPQQGGEHHQGEPRGEGQYGGGRRRHRGGRGHFRGEGGDRGPRPEGQEGGGAI